jgi:branched-chain amino acid transport system substrate-binding protein
LRAVNEIGIGDNVKLFGGGMVGLQFGTVMENLGSLLNGVVNYNSWLPEKSMYFDGTKEFFEKYTKRAVEAKVDPLGYYLAPFGYASGQLVEQAINATKSLDQKGLPNICARTRTRPSSVRSRSRRTASARKRGAAGPVPRRRGQEHRAVPHSGKQVILFPENLKSGDLVAPFEAARK